MFWDCIIPRNIYGCTKTSDILGNILYHIIIYIVGKELSEVFF